MNDEWMTACIANMLRCGLFMDPLLVHTYFRDAADELAAFVSHSVSRLYERHVHIDAFGAALEEIPFSPAVMRMCLRETLLSTAVLASYEQTGSIRPQPADVEGAYTKMDEFLGRIGADSLYLVYFVIAGHDFLQPLRFSRNVPEIEYLDGIRHHPYQRDALSLFLLLSICMGDVRLKTDGDQRVVQLTRLGRQRYQWVRGILTASGYMARRVALSYVYQFDNVEDWDEMCDTVWPQARESRRQFIKFVGIKTDSHVLEVACGTGALTFDGGLCEAVGSNGHLTAIDVSEGMLDQARNKWAQSGQSGHVTFQQACVEHLPFPDATFDAVLGSAFLHFTDGPQWIREMARTTRAGGCVAVLQGLDFSFDKPFFRDWFDPIHKIASMHTAAHSRSHFPDSGEQIVQWFEQSGLTDIMVKDATISWIFDNPQIVVQHLARGVSFFQREVMELPWDHQKTLISELMDRGRDVCRKYPLRDRIIDLHCVMVKGTRPR